MSATYVYRLEVTFPEGSSDPEWTPAGVDEHDSGVDDRGYFHFPRVKQYLSATGAETRAQLFRRYGCAVTVLRSEPVVFAEVQS